MVWLMPDKIPLRKKRLKKHHSMEFQTHPHTTFYPGIALSSLSSLFLPAIG
jgi:hypothetical protein